MNDVDYEGENVDDYEGIVVVMIVVVMVVEAAIRNKTHSKTCRVYLDDNNQELHNDNSFFGKR